MKKVIIILILLLIIIPFWYGESRKFYCLGNSDCVTVWKTYNNICYVIPGKYYGLSKPSARNYIITTNSSGAVTLFWVLNHPKSISVLASVDDSATIINHSASDAKIIDYNANKSNNDSLYTHFDGKYHRINKGINYITILIGDNYEMSSDDDKQ